MNTFANILLPADALAIFLKEARRENEEEVIDSGHTWAEISLGDVEYQYLIHALRILVDKKTPFIANVAASEDGGSYAYLYSEDAILECRTDVDGGHFVSVKNNGTVSEEELLYVRHFLELKQAMEKAIKKG